MPPTHPPQSGTSRPGRPPGKRAHKSIQLPNGDFLDPRPLFAEDSLGGVSTDTVKRMGLPTTYIGGIAHHPRKESLEIIAARIHRPQQARSRRGAR